MIRSATRDALATVVVVLANASWFRVPPGIVVDGRTSELPPGMRYSPCLVSVNGQYFVSPWLGRQRDREIQARRKTR